MDINNEEVRTLFKESGLTYADIDESRFYLLVSVLATSLKEIAKPTFPMKISPIRKKDMVFDENGVLIRAFIRVDGNYFKGREAISFNNNGFIGFCGWASTNNTYPFLKAFIEWIDLIK